MKTSEVIRSAMEYVKRGWTKHQGIDDCGNVCALGAVALASGGRMGLRDWDATVYAPAARALELKAEELGFMSVPNMNDAAETTQQDVLNMMEKTAITLELHGE